MGIKGLYKFIQRYASEAITELSSTDLKNSKIAFDTSILIYQFVIAIRNSGVDLTNDKGEFTSHIHATIMKTRKFLNDKICPIFVFDGRPPSIKLNTLNKRSEVRNNAMQGLLEDNITEEDKIKLLKQSVVITGKQMDECKEILKLMGIPIIQAKEEADSQCAFLSKNDLVDAVASEDMDLLTFGTKVLLRSMNKKKIIKIELDTILKKLNFTQEQFVDLCILMGSDYCPTIPGVGMEKAFSLIKKYGSINNFIDLEDVNIGKFKVNVTNEFKQLYPGAKDYFLNPPVFEDVQNLIKWSEPHFAELHEILRTKYSYNNVVINKMILSPLFGGHYSNLIGKTHLELNKTQIQGNNHVEDLFIDSESDEDEKKDIDQDIVGVDELLKIAKQKNIKRL